jgi:hypothetical protein
MQRLRAEQAKLEQENTELSSKLLAQQAFKSAESLSAFSGPFRPTLAAIYVFTVPPADATPVGRIAIRKSCVCYN